MVTHCPPTAAASALQQKIHVKESESTGKIYHCSAQENISKIVTLQEKVKSSYLLMLVSVKIYLFHVILEHFYRSFHYESLTQCKGQLLCSSAVDKWKSKHTEMFFFWTVMIYNNNTQLNYTERIAGWDGAKGVVIMGTITSCVKIFYKIQNILWAFSTNCIYKARRFCESCIILFYKTPFQKVFITKLGSTSQGVHHIHTSKP